MENWGLIVYRETLLLVDPHNTSASHKQNIALVVAHEIAHQWFGNLVTMVIIIIYYYLFLICKPAHTVYLMISVLPESKYRKIKASLQHPNIFVTDLESFKYVS